MVDLLPFIQIHGYWILFLLIAYEGTAVLYLGGFAASLGILNVYLVLLLGVLGNMTSDIVLFGIGKLGKRHIVNVIVKHFKFSKTRIARLNRDLRNHFGKTVLVVKVVPPLPTPGLILMGASDTPMKKFMLYSLPITIIYSFFFTLLGFYSGAAFSTVFRYVKNSSWIIPVVVLTVILIWYGLMKINSIIVGKVEKI